MNAILVSVDYADILALTLPYNRHHFEKVMVVTSLSDLESAKVAERNNCLVHATNAFYEGGADFNKWKALEEGLDVLGRNGWLCIMDADIVWPKMVTIPFRGPGKREIPGACIGNLYTPLRHMLSDIRDGIPPEAAWPSIPLHRQQREWAGYTQIFHASDPVLGPPPWHETNWRHAGGADSFFQAKWSQENKLRPPFSVLHLGESGKNWCGRVTEYVDGTLPDNGRAKLSKLGVYIASRTGKVGPERFEAEKLP